MFILIVYNNSNSFLFLWLWIIIVITLFIENILIYWCFWYCLKPPETFTLAFIFSVSTLFSFILHLHFYIYIYSHYIGQSHSALQNHPCMWCLIIFKELFFFTSLFLIVGVDYLKMKNNVTHWKKIIPDRSQIHVAPNFCLQVAKLQIYVAIICYTLLHQATRGERKNGLRERRDIFLSDRDPQRFFCIILP